MQGHPFSTEAAAAAKKAFADEVVELVRDSKLYKTKNSTLKVTAVPYGQFESNRIPAAIRKKIRKWWIGQEWPKHLLSFEAWCAMTGFDDEKEDGGPEFQALMGAMLAPTRQAKDGTNGPKNLKEQMRRNKEGVYDAAKGTYGDVFRP